MSSLSSAVSSIKDPTTGRVVRFRQRPEDERARIASEWELSELLRVAWEIGVPRPSTADVWPEFPARHLLSERRRAVEKWLRQRAAECVVECLLGRDPRMDDFYLRTARGECVYFARSHRLVKIGVSTNLKARFKDLNAMSAVPVALALWEPGGREMERALHKRFGAYRHHGEWFRPHGELQAFMRRLKARPQRKWRSGR